MKDNEFITLGIESSCDETSVAVLSGERKVLSNIISSQIPVHRLFGGVVPEIASRHHLENINPVIKEALEKANVTWDDIDLISVTKGPGLVGALVIGIAAAKALAFAKDLPVVGVNHMHGHIDAAYLNFQELKPTFMSLVVSGGHTNIVRVTDYNSFTVLGGTRDDAVGEAYDKVARVIGLGYPGGPKIDKLAKEGNPQAVNFKRVWLEKGSLDFSFSGLKTAVLNYVNSEKQKGNEINPADIAAAFQEAVVEVIVGKTMDAMAETGEKKLVLAGGVASNSRLRQAIEDEAAKRSIEVYIPDAILCTDNGAMIAAAGYLKYKEFGGDDLDIDAYPNLDI